MLHVPHYEVSAAKTGKSEIADIYDVAQKGQTAKPFGRIFYAKDCSLVFYGYDLDKQNGLKQSVTFQAWGSGEDKKNVSLGVFLPQAFGTAI